MLFAFISNTLLKKILHHLSTLSIVLSLELIEDRVAEKDEKKIEN